MAWRSGSRSLIGVLLLGLALAAAGQDASDPAGVVEQQALEDEKAAIERLREELLAQSRDIAQRLSVLKIDQVTESMVGQARVDTEGARLRQEELETQIAAGKRRIGDLEQARRDLEAREQLLRNPAREAEDEAGRLRQLERTREGLAGQRAELALERRQLENLGNRLELARRRLALVRQWQAQVEDLYRQQQERSRLAAQEDLENRLRGQRQGYLDRAAELAQRLEEAGDALSPTRRRRLETEITVLEEQANLVQLNTHLAALDNELARQGGLADRTELEPESLREGLRQLDAARSELATTDELLQRKLDLFRQQQQVIERRENLPDTDRALDAEEKKLVGAVVAKLEAFVTQVKQQRRQAAAIASRLDTAYQDALRRHLLARAPLPTTFEEWNRLLEGVGNVHQVLLHQVRVSLEFAVRSMAEAGVARWSALVLAELALAGLVALAWQGINRAIGSFGAVESARFSGRVGLLLAQLLRRNLPGVGFVAALLIAIRLLQVPQPGRGILITLVLVWIGIKIPIDLAWLILASPELPAKRQRPRLYRQWFHTLLVGGILAAMVILVHLSGVAEPVRDAFDRVFMLYLLLVLVPVARARRFFIDLLTPRYAGQFWFKGLRLLTFLLPLTLGGTAVLGIVGYLNLAWTMAGYLVSSLGVLAVWLIVQGLVNDLAALLKRHAAARAGDVLLWPQEIIDPLHKVIGIVLLLGACTVLVELYGWDTDATFTTAWQLLALTVLVVMAAYEAVYFVAGHLVRRTKSVFGGSLIRHSRKPLGIILPIAAAQLILPTLPIPEDVREVIRHALVLGQIVTVSWLVVRLSSVLEDVAVHRYLVETEDKQGARRVRTQTRMLRQIVTFAVYLIAIAGLLMTFPKVRQFGAGLLASAGVAGLVAGIAARPFLANLIAGVQIGLTQPIRLDDEVVVEGEWGRVTEINPTHVIIQIWDERRLVVPLNYFNEKPFQNWTRASTNLIGAVVVHVDYTFPVEEGRQEVQRILDTTDLWDKRMWVLQVTNATDTTMELRVLMSARDAGTAWDLRCYVREKFIEFVRKNYPQCMPRRRAVWLREHREKEGVLVGPTGASGSGA